VSDRSETSEGARHQRAHPVFRLAQAASVGLVAALLALLVWKVAAGGSGTTLVADVRAGTKPSAPVFDLPIIWPRYETWPAGLRPAAADGRVTSDELRGYPAVVNFWASWCDPCKEEAPHLAASARAHAGRVAFVGIDVQDFASDARRFLREFDVPYVSVRDRDNSTYDDYGLTGVPETYYLDARGRLVAHSLGQVSRRELEENIRLVTQSP
jgi:cytochrome c biogenesis protein CcmG/thiol:disulfide interchange protein DsbE